MGSKLFIAVYKPDEAKTILHSRNCMNKSIFYKFVQPAFGMESLLISESMWSRLRIMTAPTFSSFMIKSFFNTFVEQSLALTCKLEKVGLNKNEIIYVEHILNYTWRIACDCIMGIKLEPTKYNQCIKAIQRLKKIVSCRLVNIYIYYFDIIFNLTPLGRKQEKNLNLLHSIIDEMIQQRIELKNVNTIENEKNRTYRTFFDVQMDACRKQNFTQQEIHNNVITMLLTEKVYQELLNIYGTETIKSASIKYDDLQHMHYLDRVIKETLRIFPPAPLIGRQITKDLKIGEVVLPKGADIIIGILKMHRDEEYWSNPMMFDPDRFLPERIKDCHLCYLPFSEGPRNCMGMKYGMMCLKVMIATLVRTFIFKVNKSIEIYQIKLELGVLLSPKKPLKVKIEKRCFQ
ncbi:PREDICTED: cytochrome P450 4C1-like [Trachymyrmex septentrionalis]|uniref:cytochrome P450 4C1-like n=1 Tax=Trachymyrmex septentrionalis TaxID=34720 RepID=UPI00084F04B8|nr:PREDICTED: cytochrome P450 4C1-like [Trachymyrmex septentrionalis]